MKDSANSLNIIKQKIIWIQAKILQVKNLELLLVISRIMQQIVAVIVGSNKLQIW